MIKKDSVQKRIHDAMVRLGAPQEIQSKLEEMRWRVEGDTLFLSASAVLRDFIEQNMDVFKPIIWPFIRSNRCNKLVYEELN